MWILSLFDGMACGRIALNELRVSVEHYIAYEVDNSAIATAISNYPDIEEKGDVFKADFTEYAGKIDMLIGGSPCTYWSIARSTGRETVASGLGWELFSRYVAALREAKPKYFLYENNASMSADIKSEITKTFGIEPICINSALFTAQQRKRLYWCGIRNDDGSYRPLNLQPVDDKGVTLGDLLDKVGENGRKVEDFQFLDYKLREGTFLCCNENAIRGTQKKNGASAAESFVYYPNNKTGTLTTAHIPKVIDRADNYIKHLTEGLIRERALVNDYIKHSGNASAPIYYIKDGVLTINGERCRPGLSDGFYIIRRLTVTECKRLQGVPEGYNFPGSSAQAYKQLGNGWTVPVIAYLMNELISEE